MIKLLLISIFVLLFTLPLFAQTVDTAWVRRYNGPANSFDGAYALAVDGSGNVYVTGQSIGSGTSDDYATIRYLPNGDTAWVRRYNGPGNSGDVAHRLVVDGSGNVYVTGFSFGSGTDYDYATTKYLPNGDTAWVRRYNGPGNSGDRAYALAVDGSENVYVTGYSYSGTSDDYATIKYLPNGDTAWVRRYNGPVDSTDEAWALAVDGSGNVYVTGFSFGSGTDYDYATIKYLPNGDTAWVRRYNGPGNYFDEARALAVDGSGNIYVIGVSYGSGTSADCATIKYLPTGDTAWVRRYNGPVNANDVAHRLAVDSSGNVYVIGYSFGSGTDDDYATIKYLPNGDTAWLRRYNGPGNSVDRAYNLALDGSENVYVTGYSFGSGTNADYAILKYLPNGDTAWVRRYNGPGNEYDESGTIALDDSGNVYVTGYSYSGTSYDYATIKYLQFQQRSDTLYYFAYSPVDLIVTDPIGDSIGLGFNTIPNATYDTTQNVGGDEDKDDIVKIPNPIIGQYLVKVVAESVGTGNYTLAIKLNGNEDRVMIANAPAPGPGEVDTVTYTVPEYLHGDANRDGKKTVSDVVFLINYLFKGGPAPVPVDLGDVNFCNQNPPVPPGQPTVADVVYLVNYLFKGGPAPCS